MPGHSSGKVKHRSDMFVLQGQIALIAAVTRKHLETAKVLLGAGADPDCSLSPERDQRVSAGASMLASRRF